MAVLIRGFTDASLRRNIQILIARGYDQAQATAIAKDIQRNAKEREQQTGRG